MPKDFKPKYETNVLDYIRREYPELGRLVEHCGLQSLFSGYDHTVLIPDKSYMEEITTLAESANIDDVSRACSILQSLIIRKCMLSIDDWTGNQVIDGRYQLLKVTTAASKVNFIGADGKSYASAIKNDKFAVAFRKDKYAVWNLTGRMREETDSPAPREARRRKRAPHNVDGGYDVSKNIVDNLRFKIAIALENEFAIKCMTSSRGKVSVDPVRAAVMSFARFVAGKYPDVFYSCVLPIIRHRFTDMYFLFEPHRFDDDYLIPSECIKEWWMQSGSVGTPMETDADFREWIDHCLINARSDSTYANIGIYKYINDVALIRAIDDTRTIVLSEIESYVKIPPMMSTVYSDLSKTNRIENIDNVFPQALADYYSAHPQFKRLHDELAYVIEPKIISMIDNFDPARFQEIINIIGNALHTSGNIEDMMPLSSPKKLITLRDVTLACMARNFVNSTQFIWIPMTTSTINDYPIENVSSTYMNVNAVFNADLALALRHRRLFESNPGPTVSDIALRALSSITSEKQMSPELMAKIKSLAA